MKLEEALKSIEKRFGKEAIITDKVDVEFIPSGSIGLDLALGGGYAKGRVTELFGWESSGKSTLALHAAAEQHKIGKLVGYVDMENALDLEYASSLGVDVDFSNKRFLFSQPNNGEEALEIMREMIRIDDMGLVILDSIGALLPKAVIEGEAGDAKMALQARLMSQILPVIAQDANKRGVNVLFINQLRDKIGISFGNPQTTMGGNALKFYASQRIEVSRCGQEKDGDEVIANRTRCKIVKNKVAPPFKKCEFLIEFGTGISKIDELIDIGVQYSVIEKKGSWYAYGDVKLGQGSGSVKNILMDNPELYEEITRKIYDTIGI
jgi:recombination protein RecA